MAEPGWVGKTLGGRYHLDALLGQGGMSAVYRATDANLRRVVAVKLIHTHLTGDPEFVRRFEVEASAVAQLHHPNIIQVYDFNRDGDTYYMVLEFVSGESLHERLRRLANEDQRMPAVQAAAIAADVAGAMGYAHEQGLIHRDIKPANIMLGERGQTVLMDFGVAKIMGATQHTATGAVVGTAFYVSPEQVRGQPPSPQSDIYALGATLFEMLAGRPPFMGDSAMSVMLKHINEPPPDLRQMAPGVPVGLDEVVEQALAKEPGQRFDSAGAMADALRQATQASAMGGTEPKDAAPGRSGPSAATVVDHEPVGPSGSTPVPTAATASGLPAAAAVGASGSGPLPATKPGGTAPGNAEVPHRGGRGIWLAGGALALLLCLLLGGTAAVTGALALPFLMASNTPARPVGTPVVVFQDDFSTSAGNWTVASGTGGSAGYDQGDYVMRDLAPNWAVWSTAAAAGVLGNIHLDVTAGSTGPASDEAFGLMCGYTSDHNFDLLLFTGTGNYAIVRRAGSTTTVLTDDQGEWSHSTRITPGGQAYRVGADCGADGRLALYVDGQPIAAAKDATLKSGLIGFAVQTVAQVPAEVRFKDLIVTALP